MVADLSVFAGQAQNFNVGDGWAIASINGTEILEMPFVKELGVGDGVCTFSYTWFLFRINNFDWWPTIILSMKSLFTLKTFASPHLIQLGNTDIAEICVSNTEEKHITSAHHLESSCRAPILERTSTSWVQAPRHGPWDLRLADGNCMAKWMDFWTVFGLSHQAGVTAITELLGSLSGPFTVEFVELPKREFTKAVDLWHLGVGVRS